MTWNARLDALSSRLGRLVDQVPTYRGRGRAS
jgi:hypothetical protein